MDQCLLISKRQRALQSPWYLCFVFRIQYLLSLLKDMWRGGNLFDIVINTFSHVPPENTIRYVGVLLKNEL